MYPAMSSITPRLFSQWSLPARPNRLTSAESTLRTETTPTIAIRPELIPSTHREAIISAAIPAVLCIQTLFIRGLTNGDKRRLDDLENNPSGN